MAVSTIGQKVDTFRSISHELNEALSNFSPVEIDGFVDAAACSKVSPTVALIVLSQRLLSWMTIG